MAGFLILMTLSQWHLFLLHYGVADHRKSALLTDSRGWPVIVCDFAGSTMIIKWTGAENAWGYEFLHYGYEPRNARLDSDDGLWLSMCPLDTLGLVFIFHQTITDWDTLIYPDTARYWSYGFALNTPGDPHLFYERATGEYPSPLRHAYLQDTQWVMETLSLFYDGVGLTWGMAAGSPGNRLHYTYMTTHHLVSGYLDGGIWYEDTVEVLSEDTADFCFSAVWITVDRWGWPHLRYSPYYYGQGYKRKYAFKDASGWHVEFINDEPDDICWSAGLAIDSQGVVHAAKSDSTGIYHMVHYPGDTLWQEAERIDTLTDAGQIQIAIDGQGYLHVVFTAENNQKLVYATTSPDVGIFESRPEPRPGLALLMALGGFWITGYSGPAQIYDPAGRLVLGKEIKGKTLISPLSPGVYFVVAGKERARVAVR